MKIFITGGTGYVGSILINQLLNTGHTVHALYRPSSSKNIDRNQPNITYFEGDLSEPSCLERAMSGCDQVYHLAAYAGVWAPQSSTFYNVNVLGTRNVLSTALKLGINKVVVTSSAATLPSSADGNPVDETADQNDFETEYALSKFFAEEQARLFSRKGLHTVIVNPSRVFGPGLMSESNAVTKIIKWYLQGKWRFLPGGGRCVGNYVFVEDVARGHQQAMKLGKSGEQYILGGENSSLKELLQLVAEISHVSRKLWNVPRPVINALARVEQWKANYLKVKPLVTPPWIDNYLKNSALTSQKAVEELNYEITPLEEGLKKTIDWLTSD